jgi:hypothetical protein
LLQHSELKASKESPDELAKSHHELGALAYFLLFFTVSCPSFLTIARLELELTKTIDFSFLLQSSYPATSVCYLADITGSDRFLSASSIRKDWTALLKISGRAR